MFRMICKQMSPFQIDEKESLLKDTVLPDLDSKDELQMSTYNCLGRWAMLEGLQDRHKIGNLSAMKPELKNSGLHPLEMSPWKQALIRKARKVNSENDQNPKRFAHPINTKLTGGNNG